MINGKIQFNNHIVHTDVKSGAFYLYSFAAIQKFNYNKAIIKFLAETYFISHQKTAQLPLPLDLFINSLLCSFGQQKISIYQLL